MLCCLQPSENIAPKLKSIIVSGSRLQLGSQDSSEKHVTFQESANNTDASSMVKTKKVKFAEDTVFEQENKIKRGKYLNWSEQIRFSRIT